MRRFERSPDILVNVLNPRAVNIVFLVPVRQILFKHNVRLFSTGARKLAPNTQSSTGIDSDIDRSIANVCRGLGNGIFIGRVINDSTSSLAFGLVDLDVKRSRNPPILIRLVVVFGRDDVDGVGVILSVSEDGNEWGEI